MDVQDVSAVFAFDDIMAEAVKRQCSDVHVYPGAEGIVVQFRIHGDLHVYQTLADAGYGLIRRIKALARMDLAETRVPQDGSFSWESETLNVRCDIRVATLPTIRGEAVVMRMFPVHHSSLTFSSLGMTETQSARITAMLQATSGMILVAGRTGSGKTTTLYTMMLQLVNWGKRVVSIEDPVEMGLVGCHQMEVRERAGITFDTGLRAMLRLDPDVVMIGEIRDEPTARVALRAALTGHLVLSTTHATDIVGAAARIADLGGTRSVIGETLRGVVIQKMHRNAVGQPRHTFTIEEMTPALSYILSSNEAWQEVRQKWQQAPHVTS